MERAVFEIGNGLSMLLAAGVIVKGAKNFWLELYRDECDHCRGTGKVVCKHCHGTKDLRRGVGVLDHAKLQITENPAMHTPCIWCGPDAPFDFVDWTKPPEDDVDQAYAIMDNFKAAIVNKPVPKRHRGQPWAGAIDCPACEGAALVWRHTPNLVRALGCAAPWQEKVALQGGVHWAGDENRPPFVTFQHAEYPGGVYLPDNSPMNEPTDGYKPPFLTWVEKQKGPAKDYLYTFVDDSDTEVDD